MKLSPDNPAGKSRAVFIDRDDTLIQDVPYLGDPSKVTLLPGAREALSRLRDAGFLIVMVSNQSGIARGLITHEQVRAVNQEVTRQLSPATIHATYYSPDGPDGVSETRKPAPGMLLAAARDHDIDLAQSYMVGDKASDVACGRNAGCQTILISAAGSPAGDDAPSFTARTLSEAADWILKQS